MRYSIKCDGRVIFPTPRADHCEDAGKARLAFAHARGDIHYGRGELIAESATGSPMTLDRFAH